MAGSVLGGWSAWFESRLSATFRCKEKEGVHPVDISASPAVAYPVAAAAPANPKPVIPTPALLLAMLRVSNRVSDLIISPGSLPHVEVSGQLVPLKIPGLQLLTPDDTRR